MVVTPHVGQAGMGQSASGAPAGLPSRSQRFAISIIDPEHRLPGWLAQPEGKFHVTGLYGFYSLPVCRFAGFRL